jgi:hypothetical protein
MHPVWKNKRAGHRERRPIAQRFVDGSRAAIILVAVAAASHTGADDDQKLDQFLSRLGLTDLRLTHMERMLALNNAYDKRAAIARDLADAYAEELVAAADEPEWFAKVKDRAEKLLNTFPEARTPAASVALLQADYQRAETLMICWLEERSDKAPLGEAAAILTRILPELESRQSELAAAADRGADVIDTIRNEQQRQAAEEQIKRQRAVAARADYFAGWSAYYLGIAAQNPATAQKDYATAGQHFMRLLDISDEKDYAPVEAETLGLDSIWKSRAVIGLGLAELGRKRLGAASRIFGWLAHASVPPTIRDQVGYWRLQGMLNAGLVNEATRLVTTSVAAFSSNPSSGNSSLCIAAVRAGAASRTKHSSDAKLLIEQGIRGLARMRQFETLDDLIDKYKLDDAFPGDFCLTWLRGRRMYLAAEKAKKPEGFRAAGETLASALSLPEAKQDVTDAGQARYYLAWARYRLDEFDAAARLFHEAAIALQSPAPDVAVQSAWMHCTCLAQLATKDKRHVAAAVAALQTFKQDFPASEEAQRAELLLTRLRQNHSAPQEAIRELAAIQPGQPTYVSAQYEICQLQHELWTKTKSDAAKSERLAAELLKAVERFLALNSGETDERRLKAVLLAVDALQSAPSPSSARIRFLLGQVSPVVDRLDPSNGAVIEYQYRRMQLAQNENDQSSVVKSGKWIVDYGAGTPYELPALVVMAREADKSVASASAAEIAPKIAEASKLYTRLVVLLGDSPAILSSNKNAFAAMMKLAQYDAQSERWPQAADRLNRLLEAQPRDRRVLRRAGLASYHAGRYAESLDHWRMLIAGLETGSDDWLEAKYYQLACLEKTDRATAAKVLQQFQVLFPEVKSAAWRPKFAELENALHE